MIVLLYIYIINLFVLVINAQNGSCLSISKWHKRIRNDPNMVACSFIPSDKQDCYELGECTNTTNSQMFDDDIVEGENNNTLQINKHSIDYKSRDSYGILTDLYYNKESRRFKLGKYGTYYIYSPLLCADEYRKYGIDCSCILKYGYGLALISSGIKTRRQCYYNNNELTCRKTDVCICEYIQVAPNKYGKRGVFWTSIKCVGSYHKAN